MSRYVFRYFFDPGSKVCLWSANDDARERFGYPVEIESLRLSQNLNARALHLVHWYDTSIDWSSPADPSPWSDEERARFAAAAHAFLEKLREFLGSEFEIRDEVQA
jgi:hypothetical protein